MFMNMVYFLLRCTLKVITDYMQVVHLKLHLRNDKEITKALSTIAKISGNIFVIPLAISHHASFKTNN